jgi:hypothetical protein
MHHFLKNNSSQNVFLRDNNESTWSLIMQGCRTKCYNQCSMNSGIAIHGHDKKQEIVLQLTCQTLQ